MFFAFALISIIPLALFLLDPKSWVWLPWLSLGLFLFGSWILIPKRRVLMAIPLLGYIGALGGLLLLVEQQLFAVLIVLLIGGGAWLWWRMTALHGHEQRILAPALMLCTGIVVYGLVHGAGAMSIYLSASLWATTLLVAIASLCFFVAISVLLAHTSATPLSWISAAGVQTLVLTGLFVTTNFLSIALSMKAVAITLVMVAILDGWQQSTAGGLTYKRTSITIGILLLAILVLWWTATWI